MAALSPLYHMYGLNGKLSVSKQSYHTVELFLDFVCPYSAKLWTTLYNNHIFEQNQNVQFIFRHQIQPWHTQSTLVHTVAMAVAKHTPDRLVETMNTLFQQQTDFYDDKVENLTQIQIYEKLLDTIKVPEVKIDQFRCNKGGNSGNSLTDDVKYHIKYSRKHGVHVSPTVFVNGLEEEEISSSWTKEQWSKFLEELVKA